MQIDGNQHAERIFDRAVWETGGESLESWFELSQLQGWGDGLPLVPPTPERVARFITESRFDPQEAVAAVPPSWRAANTTDVAINAVMAGLPVECFKILLAALHAVSDKRFNLHSVQATTNPAAPTVVVNGPVRDECSVQYGYGCMGPGWTVNATLGRALRLVLLNVGGAHPGELDRATHGQPAKFTFVFGENEAESPWEALSTSRGFAPGRSYVSVFAAHSFINHLDNTSRSSDELVRGLARTLTCFGSNPIQQGGETLIIPSPEHAEILARTLTTRLDVQQALYELATVPASAFAPQHLEKLRRQRVEYPDAVSGPEIHAADEPTSISLVVAGGFGGHTVFVPTLGSTRSVTVEIPDP